ncbi:HAD family phosphatase [candidate division WWE3 bacterium]|uniref:phosphoserine phosphatase n=1 Tax=candidate division WWE3 bacterium TaxID=2053526 RepID=A0A955LG89_UNCKA|nr:HAD family phosphatase [candidate division WWE3 bacterium]
MEDIKLVVFDLNKTLVKENTWYELNLAMGVTPEEDEKFLKWYESGKITYDEGQKFLEEIYHERGEATRENMVAAVTNYQYVKGAKEIIAYLKDKGYEIALITGAIDILAEKVSKELGIELYAAHNQFVFNPDHTFKKIISHDSDYEFKVHMLWKFCNKLDIDVTQTVCVGDGDNDTGLFEVSQHGVTFRGSRVEDRAWKVIDELMDISDFL